MVSQRAVLRPVAVPCGPRDGEHGGTPGCTSSLCLEQEVPEPAAFSLGGWAVADPERADAGGGPGSLPAGCVLSRCGIWLARVEHACPCFSFGISDCCVSVKTSHLVECRVATRVPVCRSQPCWGCQLIEKPSCAGAASETCVRSLCTLGSVVFKYGRPCRPEGRFPSAARWGGVPNAL